jgi:hypothetical protein
LIEQFPNAFGQQSKILSLPMFGEITRERQDEVTDLVRDFCFTRRALSCIVLAQRPRRRCGTAKCLPGMKLFETIAAILNAWTGSVAAAIIAGFDRVVSPRVVRLIEDDKGGFAIEAAAKLENVPAHIAFADGAHSAWFRLAGWSIRRALINTLKCQPWRES